MRYLAQKFHDHLIQEAGARPSSVNAAITAVYHYYGYLGERVRPVLRNWVTGDEPRVLRREEQEKLIQAIALQKSVRDRALLSLLFFTGIRIGECRELKISDIEISAHTGRVRINSGKRSRSVPLNRTARQALLQWLIERAARSDCEDERPLFPNKTGKFMTRAALDEIVRKVGASAQLKLCAQILRNTFLSTLLERGNTLELVAELGGQSKLEHVRRFARNQESLDSLEAFLDGFWTSKQEVSLS